MQSPFLLWGKGSGIGGEGLPLTLPNLLQFVIFTAICAMIYREFTP